MNSKRHARLRRLQARRMTERNGRRWRRNFDAWAEQQRQEQALFDAVTVPYDDRYEWRDGIKMRRRSLD